MATIKYVDDGGLRTTLELLKAKLATIYVQKETGKGLSTNDLTNELLTKLNNSSKVEYTKAISSGTLIGTIKINDVSYEIYVPQGQSIEIDKVMSETSENPVENKVIKKYVDDAIADISGIEFKVVASLPSQGEKGVIYLLPKTSAETQNIYEEYIWMESTSTYEKIGDTAIDMKDYLKKEDLVPLTTEEINTVFTGVFGATS